MKYSLLFAFLLARTAFPADDAREKTPQLQFRVVENFFKFPENYINAEAVGVTVGPQGHILIANRGNHPVG